jgi:hypothetical protein
MELILGRVKAVAGRAEIMLTDSLIKVEALLTMLLSHLL